MKGITKWLIVIVMYFTWIKVGANLNNIYIQPAQHLKIKSPTYCIDPAILQIINSRATQCFSGNSSVGELDLLRNISVVDYHHSHEILAYQYFVEYKNNPGRRSCDLADMEFIPLLPLAWRSGYPTATGCTAGGYCPQNKVLGSSICSVQRLINDIVEIVKYIKNNRKQDMHEGLPKFTVASTYNLRTYMAFGLPSSVRSGPIHGAITSFVTALSIGHYERQPQCPDILRKQWKLLVEIPMFSLFDTPEFDRTNHNKVDLKQYDTSTSTKSSLPLLNIFSSNTNGNNMENINNRQQNTFLFSGRLLLWLADKVCSIRHTVATQLGTRDDTIILNITESQSYGPINEMPLKLIHLSKFCIVTKTDSYSSAFFYEALFGKCIPIIISDWFVFAFPAIIPYRLFVIRINEDDFQRDPHGVLNYIKITYTNEIIKNMKKSMLYWLKYLTFSNRFSTDYLISERLDKSQITILNTSLSLQDCLKLDHSNMLTTTVDNINTVLHDTNKVILPFELMLREMVYHRKQHQLSIAAEKNKHLKKQQDSVNMIKSSNSQKLMINSLVGTDSDMIMETRDLHCYSPASCLTRVPGIVMNKHVIKDIRSHLCKHSTRLIGHYKIVFFMQCVRMLWPLSPGSIRPFDKNKGGLSNEDIQFIRTFHNVSKNTSTNFYSTFTTYPILKEHENSLKKVLTLL